MKVKERLKNLRDKSNKELIAELNKSYEELRKTRFKASLGELKDVTKIKKIKKDIARILTILSEKLRVDTKNQKGEK